LKDKNRNENFFPEHYDDGKNYSLFSWIKSLKPLYLSHHPNCAPFKKHVITIRNKHFCIGCIIGYPSALLGVIFIYFILEILAHDFLLFMGIVLMASFFLSPLKLTNLKKIKVLQKILFNLGGAFLFWWIFKAPLPFYYNLINFIFIFGILLTLINLYHAASAYKTCKNCIHDLDWDTCPGFQEMRTYCKKNNLPYLFKTQFRKKEK